MLSQKQIRRKTQAISKKQEKLQRHVEKLGGELAKLEKLCKQKHTGKSCDDCSWEAD